MPATSLPYTDLELIDVRTDEQLDLARLEPWLRDHLPAAEGPLLIRQFGGGLANLTYLVRFGEREYVLRRPPLGPIARTSHDMKREHRVLTHLYQAFPLAPRSFVLCDDPTILGVDFHVTERRRGFVIRGDLPERFRHQPPLNRRLSEMIVDTLVALRRVDAAAVGLGDLGQPHGFVRRQLDGWAKRWHAAKHEQNERVDRLLTWLGNEMPESGTVSLLHNDYKLDNILVDVEDPCTPVAVLDWDMSTRGDPLVELGYLLNFWVERGDDPEWIAAAGMPTHHRGFLTRTEVVDRYARQSGFDVGRIRWYHVFGVFKLIVILQQIYIRFLRGQTRDQRFSRFGKRVESLAAKGCALLEC